MHGKENHLTLECLSVITVSHVHITTAGPIISSVQEVPGVL